MKMEPIDFTCELALVKSYEKAGEFHVVGYACTEDFDLQGDIISREAMKDSEHDLLSNSTVLFNHDDECPIGRIVKQSLDVKGMLIDAIIDKVAVVPKIRTKVIDAIKQKILNKFSIRAKVLDAGKEFVSELGRVANVIKKMLLIECSLVSVPANPEAKALAWYITKALDGGLKMEEEKDEVIESEGLPEVEDLEKKKSDEEEDEEEEGKKKEIKIETKSENQKGFPAPEVLEKEWADLCKEKELTTESEADKVNETWKELCEKQAYPSPYPYPYPSAKREATDQIMFLCDKLIGGADKKVSAIAQEIKAITSRLVGETYPYPKPYPYPQPAKSKEAEGEKIQRDDQNEKSAKLIEQLMKDVASIKKSVEQKEKEVESKIVRKGLVKDEEAEKKEDTVEKGLDKELENKTPDEQLRILVARQEG